MILTLLKGTVSVAVYGYRAHWFRRRIRLYNQNEAYNSVTVYGYGTNSPFSRTKSSIVDVREFPSIYLCKLVVQYLHKGTVSVAVYGYRAHWFRRRIRLYDQNEAYNSVTVKGLQFLLQNYDHDDCPMPMTASGKMLLSFTAEFTGYPCQNYLEGFYCEVSGMMNRVRLRNPPVPSPYTVKETLRCWKMLTLVLLRGGCTNPPNGFRPGAQNRTAKE